MSEIIKALKLLELWGCSLDQVRIILNAPDLITDEIGFRYHQVDITEEQKLRADLILDINEILNNIFNNPQNIDNFMAMKNKNEPFNGISPITMMSFGKLSDLRDVHAHLSYKIYN